MKSPGAHCLATGNSNLALRLSMLAMLAVAVGLALFVDLEEFYPFWQWVKFPWKHEARAGLLLGAFAGLGLSAVLFAHRRLWGLLAGSVFLRLVFEALSNYPFHYRQRQMYFEESFVVDLKNVVFNYSAAIDQAAFSSYLETKPPGTMLYYKSLYWLFRPFVSDPNGSDLYYLANFMSYGILTALGLGVLALLYFAINERKGERWALTITALYALSPHYLLLPLEFSTRLSPLLVLGIWWLCRTNGSYGRVVLGGALWAFGTYMDFGILAVLAIPLVQLVFHRSRRDAVRGLLCFLAGGACFYLPVIVGTGYNPAGRFLAAMAAHEQVFGVEGLPAWKRTMFGIVEFGELLLVAGPGLVALFFAGLGQGGARRYGPFLVYMAGLIASGSVVSESARLWVVMIGPMAVVASEAAANRGTRWLAVGCHGVLVGVFFWMGYFTWSQ